MNRLNDLKEGSGESNGPVVPGSPLYRLLEQIGRAVAKRLLARAEATEATLTTEADTEKIE